MTDFDNPYPALREMEAVPLFRDLGYHFSDAGDGFAEITFAKTDRTQNLYGIVHGGVWLFLADSAMGAALGTVVEPEHRVITTQADFRWLRGLAGDTIVAKARVLRRGRTVSHCAVELFDEDNKLIGSGSGTYLVQVPTD